MRHPLFDRLAALFEHGHASEVAGLKSDRRLHADDHQFRDAAVLIAVTERDDPGVLLIHRPKEMRSHAGQVAFPGGKVDPGEDVETAALREAWEELGIRPQDVQVIGSSDPYYTGTGFHITPVLATVPADLSINPNPAEVDSWFEAPLRFILDRANHMEKSIIYQGTRRHYLEMPWEGHHIWGATAAIIHNLSLRIRHGDL